MIDYGQQSLVHTYIHIYIHVPAYSSPVRYTHKHTHTCMYMYTCMSQPTRLQRHNYAHAQIYCTNAKAGSPVREMNMSNYYTAPYMLRAGD